MEKQKVTLKHEQIVLGSMLRERDVRKRLVNLLSDDSFLADRHRVIFIGLQAIEDQHLDYTPGTLETQINESDWGGKEYLGKLEGMGQVENVDHHITQMLWDKVRLECYEKLVPELATELKDPHASVDDISRLVKGLNDRIGDAKGQKFYEHGSNLSNRYSASIQARRVQQTFRSSGYVAIDKKLSEGFAPGRVSVITGAPSSGKTTFALNMAMRQARKWKVGYIAWEGGIQSALDIMVASKLKIPLDKMLKLAHMLTDEEQSMIDEYVARILKDHNLSFLRQPPRDILRGNPWDVNERVLDWVESQLADWDRDIVYWDLFEKRFAARKPDHIALALDRVQEMVAPNRLYTHMSLLHQITFKVVEKREDQRPTRDALKGSGAYIEVPDLVLSTYRPAIYENGVVDNILEVGCLKQRRGAWPWRIIMNWEGEYAKVSGGREGQLVIKEEPDDDYEKGKV